MDRLIPLYVSRRVARGELTRDSARCVRLVLYSFATMAPSNIRSIQRRHVERFLEQPAAAGYKRRRLSTLRTFFKWLILEGKLTKDPSIGIASPRQPRLVPRGLSPNEVAAVYTAAKAERERVIALLMVQEGLRAIEVCRVGIGDVDWQARTVFIVGKGGHERRLPLSDQTWAAINRYLDAFPAASGPLLRNKKWPDRALRPQYVSTLMSELFAEAGVKTRPYDGKSGHALRHTMATDMVLGGANIIDIQLALGHANIATTRRYLPNNVGNLRDAMGGRRYGFAAPVGPTTSDFIAYGHDFDCEDETEHRPGQGEVPAGAVVRDGIDV